MSSRINPVDVYSMELVTIKSGKYKGISGYLDRNPYNAGNPDRWSVTSVLTGIRIDVHPDEIGPPSNEALALAVVGE